MLILVGIALATNWAAGFIAPARKSAQTELVFLRAKRFKNAQTLATPAFAKQLASPKFQTTWNTFVKKYPPAGPPVWKGVDSWPTTNVNLTYGLPSKTGGSGIAILLMVKQNNIWRVDGLQLFEKDEDWLRTDPKYAANHAKKNYRPGQSWWFPGTAKAAPKAGITFGAGK